jgi:hypothetical protein
MKFLLMCFVDMSVLKINYHKSEVIVMGQPGSEQLRIANNLNCQLGASPSYTLTSLSRIESSRLSNGYTW